VTSLQPRLGPGVLDELDLRLAPADAELAARYPGDASRSTPSTSRPTG
jgi:hypothetical protein